MPFRSIYFIVAICFFSCEREKETTLVSSIVPKPASINLSEGRFTFNAETKLVFENSTICHPGIYIFYLKELTGYELKVAKQTPPNSIVFKLDEQQGSGHQIKIDDDQITISGASCEALLQGFQSIRQLLLLNSSLSIPNLELTDYPKFSWRGLLLDCSRHFMDKEFVKKYVDALALYKMNVLHWHLTEDQGWRIEIDKYPKLTEVSAWRDDGNGGRYGGFYTKDDIREIVSYAEERGITVVPEVELPGHSQAALAAYPHLSCTGGPFEVETEWGVFKEIYCAGNEDTFTFLEEVLTEVIDLFPSEYVHIGGDEVPKFRWERCEKCQRRIQEEGLHDTLELQSYFISRIGDFIESKGKKMIGWDEILEGGLADGAIVQSWRGFEGAAEAVKMGHQAIVSPTSHAYFDYGLNDIDMEKVYAFNPVPDGLNEQEEGLILGGECNMWTERAPQPLVDGKVFPRILAMAEVLWSESQNRDFQEFRRRVADQYKLLDRLDISYGFETIPVKVESEVVRGQLMAKLVTYDSSFRIFYQSQEEKKEYIEPVAIEQAETWEITFQRGEVQFKDTIRQEFLPHHANGILPTYGNSYHQNYTAGGDLGLSDGLKGSKAFRDGRWQGYWGDDVEITIDLGNVRNIRELSSGYLQYNNAWIFFPVEVSYELSEDGVSYKEVGVVKNTDRPENKEQKTQEYTLNLAAEQPARFVRMKAKNLGVCPDWHDAAGSDAWIFIDEISVR